MIVLIILLFLIIFYVLHRIISGNEKYLYFILIFFLFQYLMINSNPYKDPKTSKLSIMDYVPDEYKPKTELYNESSNYKYPFILKPNVCTKDSGGVKVIKNKKQLEKYFKKYPKKTTIYQEFIDADNEIGIFYERNPLHKNGKIISIVKRDYMGGESIKPQLHKNFLFNGSANLRNDLITPELTRVINKISKKIPDYYCGRYDIRYYDKDNLKKGKNFYILEANGTMGFDLRTKTHGYLNPKTFWIKLRFILVRLWFGILNIYKRSSLNINCVKNSLTNAIKCKDWEKLYCVYS